MKKYVQKLLQNQFIRHFLTLFSGTVIAQLILFGITPILTRIYAEYFFGILTLFTSVVTILKIVTTLMYEITLVLPKKDKNAINLLALNILIIFSISFLILILTIIFKNSINSLFDDGGLHNYIYLIAPCVFSLGLIESFTYWNNRFKRYDNISYTRISKSLAVSGAQLLVGFSKINYIGLIPGMIVGQFVSLIHLIIISLSQIKKLVKYISFKRMFFLLKKYSDVPKYNTLLSLSNTISNQIPGLLLPTFFGLTLTGYFGMSTRIVASPYGLVGQSIGQVFYKKSADIINSNPSEFYSFIKKTYKNLFLIGISISVLIFFITFFFEFILGKGWGQAGLYSRILIPWLFLMFLNSPVSSIIVILNKQKIMIIYDLILLISRTLALFLGYYIYKNIIASLIFYSFVGVCFNLFLTYWFLTIAKKTYINAKQ